MLTVASAGLSCHSCIGYTIHCRVTLLLYVSTMLVKVLLRHMNEKCCELLTGVGCY